MAPLGPRSPALRAQVGLGRMKVGAEGFQIRHTHTPLLQGAEFMLLVGILAPLPYAQF